MVHGPDPVAAVSVSPLQLELPSAPIDGETLAVVESVAHDWTADPDWRRFASTVMVAALESDDGETVHVGVVRRMLTNDHGLTIAPRRLSAFWNRAASKAGFLDFDSWEVNDDHAGKNAGRPQRVYRLRT